MKNSKTKFVILLMSLSLSAASAFAQGKLLKDVSLAFQAGSTQKTLIKLDSFSPLKITSVQVSAIQAVDKSGKKIEGVVWNTADARNPTRSGYWFNSSTQCWIWGTYEILPGVDRVIFYPGTASEQAAHNVCAPLGEYYCKP